MEHEHDYKHEQTCSKVGNRRWKCFDPIGGGIGIGIGFDSWIDSDTDTDPDGNGTLFSSKHG